MIEYRVKRIMRGLLELRAGARSATAAVIADAGRRGAETSCIGEQRKNRHEYHA